MLGIGAKGMSYGGIIVNNVNIMPWQNYSSGTIRINAAIPLKAGDIIKIERETSRGEFNALNVGNFYKKL